VFLVVPNGSQRCDSDVDSERVDCMTRSDGDIWVDLASDLVPKITCQVVSPGLSPAYGFEHPASTLPARFPAALDIGHGPACGLANACALVYVAA